MEIKEDDIPSLIKKGLYQSVIPQLYKKVLPVVQKQILKNQGRKEDAFDVFQDALLLFYKQVVQNTYNEKYKVYGYVYRISLNLWINKIKRDKKITLSENLPDDQEWSEVDGSQKQIPSKFTNQLLDKIGDKCKEVLNYSIFTDIQLEDVQLSLDYPSVSALKMQIQRCKQKLKELLQSNPDYIRKLKERDFND
ncbi:MAG: sigma-70 family RNA polymerase sigma factor [Cytophagaceae bacterium]